jgi:uncharacterized cupredoxin-like copper-binding protein
MTKHSLTLLAVIALALGLAACGSSASSSSSSSGTSGTSSTAAAKATGGAAVATGSSTVAIAAQPTGKLMFTTNTLTAKAGKVTFVFTNHSPLGHNFTLQQGTDGKILGATPTFTGGSRTLVLTLKPGMYTYFCSVPGHRQAGMQGVLTVS